MQAEKNVQVKQDCENLFRDNYGILRLAAHATLTKAPASSKIPDYLRLKWTQWVKRKSKEFIAKNREKR